jgi:hypothetical protein
MTVLFVMRHSGYVRNFESTLRMLCERGHVVHLGFQGRTKYDQLDPTHIAQQLADRYPTFTYGEAPIRNDGWGLLGRDLRLGRDYLRYLRPEYRGAPKLRARATRDAPPWVVRRAERGLLATSAGRAVLSSSLLTMNSAIPRDPAIDRFVRESKADLLIVTPLIEPGSPQVDYVTSARAHGIPTALCVASWDNLTNKGLIHEAVDLVAVWNDAMKDEAVRFHGVAPERVAVTGAAAFDHWFDWRPSTTREAFCARVGLRADRPYLLYLCSSRFVAPDEVPFVRRWVEELRRSTGTGARGWCLVRPASAECRSMARRRFRGVGQRCRVAALWRRTSGCRSRATNTSIRSITAWRWSESTPRHKSRARSWDAASLPFSRRSFETRRKAPCISVIFARSTAASYTWHAISTST